MTSAQHYQQNARRLIVPEDQQRRAQQTHPGVYFIAKNNYGHQLLAIRDYPGQYLWLLTLTGGHTFQNVAFADHERKKLPTSTLAVCEHGNCAKEGFCGKACKHIQQYSQLPAGTSIPSAITFNGAEPCWEQFTVDTIHYDKIQSCRVHAQRENLPVVALVMATQHAFVFSPSYSTSSISCHMCEYLGGSEVDSLLFGIVLANNATACVTMWQWWQVLD
eukprot:TRINITY_DN60744_c0_g3_i1.p1 TRINITY_DN60744_c0_g3~~TRINITY_DN60744_c0_g3_i1.p1  ORF type:complete len:219 (-),score=17.96 TRINITY_DN60744_c0_g3_i1:34-690(-)